METSPKHGYGSGRFYVEHQGYHSSDNTSQATTYSSVQTLEQHYTLESSSRTNSFPNHNNSPSSANFSPHDSPASQLESNSYALMPQQSLEIISGSLEDESCLTNDLDDLSHVIRELETAMRGTDTEILGMYDTVVPMESNRILSEAEKWKLTMDVASRGDLKEMLFACAKAMDANDIEITEYLMSEMRKMVSISGNPVQRIGAYMLESLVARMACSGSAIYKALKCKEPTGNELLSYMHLLFEICPYFKFGYLSANGAIAEAMKEENRVHIIDFQINQGSQWISLIQALAGRPGGPPALRITGFDDSFSNFARGGGLDIVGKRLTRLAQSCQVPFEFHAAGVAPSKVQLEDLKLQPGEAVAVNFAMMLHHVPDETVDSHNPRERLLRLAKHICPKVVTLVEQESNTNRVPFFPRFAETLDYYLPVFESIDVVLPREHKERINVEQHCLARELVNLVACEGAERVERHEPLRTWRSRFAMAGFKPYPLSSFVNSTIKNLLENYCGNYTLEERDGALYLGWMNRPLVASCAWR
ncbi:scarecrow-like protein 21 isoform X1 [Neltuma alba]|uniref:scarecrow-like protein 21 isoform X1 n=1 Tax=Neltuma alba TaxID=207710 RepID=UPI0010A4B376|nr:scarecrow-like protein 21 isoform X1 [Prosopis alba]